MYKKEIWKIIPNLKINGILAPYWVINERAVRATAWIMFSLGFFTMLTTIYTKNYILLEIVVSLFFIDFLIKFINWPKYSPLSFIWSFLVRKQNPEWVWAIQKRFAWAIWVIMSWSMIIISIIFEIRWITPLIICSICLIFMWMEVALWICAWCNIYTFLEEKWIIKKNYINLHVLAEYVQ